MIVNYVRNDAAAAEVVEAIKAMGRKAIAVRANVGDPSQVERLFSEADHALERLDILINNAAIGTVKPLEEVTPEFWDEILRVDLTGPFSVLRLRRRG